MIVDLLQILPGRGEVGRTMPKNIVEVQLQRPTTNIPWGFVVCGGRDQVYEVGLGLRTLSTSSSAQGLTLKVGNVKRMTPASRAGLCKMDYLINVSLKFRAPQF